MNSLALAMMLLTKLTITAITLYFFYKVLNTPPKAVDEDDASYPRGG